MTETLQHPIEIAPNLQAGVRTGGGWITCGYSKKPGAEGRTRYRWEIIFKDGSDCSGDDLLSGVGGGNLTEGLTALLSYLAATAEANKYHTWMDQFPEKVLNFVRKNANEIDLLAYDLNDITY